MFFNPFSHLSINNHYPLAKVRRSTLQERFEDTFEVFNGKITDYRAYKYLDRAVNYNTSHVGLLDYLLFPVLLPLMWYLYFKNKPNSSLTKFVMGFKAVISFFLTAGCFLFVIIGHGISLAVNEKEDTKIKTLNIIADKEHEETNSNEHVDENVSTKTKKTVITEEKCKIEEKNCEGELWEIAPCKQRLENSTYALDKANDIGKDEVYLSVNKINNEDWFPFSDYSFFNVKIPVTEKNKAGIRWMLESNYNHILERISEEDFGKLVNKIEEPEPVKLKPLG